MATNFLHRLALAGALFLSILARSTVVSGAVPQGSLEKARAYYRSLAVKLGFRDSTTIFDSTLDDVLVFAGFAGLTADDLQRLPSDLLMNPVVLGKPCPVTTIPDGGVGCPSAVAKQFEFTQAFSTSPLGDGEIISIRYFAPKIINVDDPPNTRSLGWRKLVRLRARAGSQAIKHGVQDAIILFNFFTAPGVKPFDPSAESVNTQVILTTPGIDGDAIYWLDYESPARTGRLSMKLEASFDAGDLQATSPPGHPHGVRPYFVPDGCVACHGENPQKALLNYLDTDHWLDRLDDDFARVRQEGNPVLFDGDTDNPAKFDRAFDVIRQFNKDVEQQLSITQKNGFHLRAVQTWLRIHEGSTAHVSPIERSVASSLSWSAQSPNDTEVIGKLNRYCFRCHGSIRFNVFDKADVAARREKISSHMKPSPRQLKADPGYLMPPDRRKMNRTDRDRILQLRP